MRTMKLLLERLQLDADVTIGQLVVDGAFECWVLEDPVREVPGQPVASWKVPGQTAIPYGAYQIDITPSTRFKVDLPLLLNVPGYSGVRIHPGNTTANTEGCLLPGVVRMAKSVGKSRLAHDALFAKIRQAKRRGEPISIEIV